MAARRMATGRPLNWPRFAGQPARVRQLLLGASWYRDYVSYCGVSDDGKKVFATVVQLSRRRPVVKKSLSGVTIDEARPDSACSAPVWQRGPVRVSFEPSAGGKQTFAIRGTVADVVANPEDNEESDD